ncbi:right-handed parallel beta-helix repeat-containing protein [Klebsiella pneumoniae]|uniref:right-handed parallel beta-helix repeat-containing protein n=1 Tax=Klebsiella pneumoniae TaxID=573 RepID=UPI002FF32E2B|nr:right-handed parallel beta-helix repeat-containing protein [Klebsiella pneumoniae]
MAQVPLPTPTDNQVPSTDIRDAVYAGAMLDKAMTTTTDMTYEDRLGNEHKTWHAIEQGFDDIVASLDTASFTFPDEESGLAGTTDGQYFRVPQGEGAELAFIYYRNNAGVAQIVATTASGEIAKLVKASSDGNLVVISDIDGVAIEVKDDFGGINIPGIPAPVQEALAPIKKDRAPAILRLSDAENALYGAIDDFGGLHIPGIPESIQSMILSHQAKIQKIIKNRMFLDVRDCGFNAKTGENGLYAIQRAINWLSGQGGGSVFIPGFPVPLSSFITPRSNVSIIGGGVGKTILLPYKANAAIKFLGGPTNYLQNMIMSDFTVDGENQTLNPTSGFLPEIKGTFIQYWKDVVMERLKFLNTGATAIGNDMPYNCAIMNCYVENAGRLAPNPDAGIWERPLGSSGIGLGTGALDDEPIFVAFNVARKCANFGLFFEPQGGAAARGAVAVGNILEENYAGLSDCGIDGLQATANQMRFNKYGLLRYPGTNNSGKPGRRAQFNSNVIELNTSHGVYSYSAKTDPLIGWNSYKDNRVMNNGEDGFNFRYTVSTVAMQNETISGNDIAGNGRHGIHIEAAKEVVNCDFTANKIWGNGNVVSGDGIHSAVPFRACAFQLNPIRDTQDTPTQQYPINLTGVLTDVDISLNHCVGNVNNTINTPNAANQRVTKNINSGAL